MHLIFKKTVERQPHVRTNQMHMNQAIKNGQLLVAQIFNALLGAGGVGDEILGPRRNDVQVRSDLMPDHHRADLGFSQLFRYQQIQTAAIDYS